MRTTILELAPFDRRYAAVRRHVAMVLLTSIVLLSLGCATVGLRQEYLGIRPTHLDLTGIDSVCERYTKMFDNTQWLQEAYHSRATQNRWWIYVAGTLALGTTAATGGMGAAGAAALSIALVSVSGGFTSGFFAFLNNSDLAEIYTISANQLAEGLQKSEVLYHGSGNPSVGTCTAALDVLTTYRTNAETALEKARTSAAAAAVLRVEAQARNIREITDQVDLVALRRQLQGARIEKVAWLPDARTAQASVAGGEPFSVPIDGFLVTVGGAPGAVESLGRDTSTGQLVLTFVPPEEPPSTPAVGRIVQIVVPAADVTITGQPAALLARRAPEPAPPLAAPAPPAAEVPATQNQVDADGEPEL